MTQKEQNQLVQMYQSACDSLIEANRAIKAQQEYISNQWNMIHAFQEFFEQLPSITTQVEVLDLAENSLKKVKYYNDQALLKFQKS